MPKTRNSANPPAASGEPARNEELSLNLLDDPLITVRTPEGMTTMSLPQLYAALAKNTVEDLVYLRPHQRHPLHSTICQIGAVAMVKAGLTEAPDDAEQWREILSALTAREHPGHEPWRLAVPDITKPAFMQPPAETADKTAEYRKRLDTPDAIDLTVGSKRHDVKDGVIRHAKPEHWLYALIACQTASGFEGNGLYGVSRMNGGLSNRHGFSLTPDTRWGTHIARDMDLLAKQHQGKNVAEHLLWTRKWSGTPAEAIPLDKLQPMALYVEACKRIRLIATADGVSHAVRASSKAARVHAKESKGRTEDPWMLNEQEQAVTVSRNGFGYREVSHYLDPERYQLPELAKPKTSDGDAVHLVARTLVRGQGKTEGYHESEIPLRNRMTGMLRTPAGQDELAAEAKQRVDCVSEVSGILRHAVKTYLQNGVSTGQTKKEHRKVIDDCGRHLQLAVEADFWERLQDGIESSDQKLAQAEWVHRWLAPQASKILESVHKTSLCRAQDRFRAIAESSDLFGRRIRASKKLPERPE
jgi:CRISPR system Cascade subunit CasA